MLTPPNRPCLLGTKKELDRGKTHRTLLASPSSHQWNKSHSISRDNFLRVCNHWDTFCNLEGQSEGHVCGFHQFLLWRLRTTPSTSWVCWLRLARSLLGKIRMIPSTPLKRPKSARRVADQAPRGSPKRAQQPQLLSPAPSRRGE